MPENLPNLNDKVAELPTEPKSKETPALPSEVARSDKMSDHENKAIVFTFLPYKHSHCEIAELDKKEAKKLTRTLKEINKVVTKSLHFSHSSGIDCKRVHNSGRYSCLFNGLPPDIRLLEIDYTNTGRIFGYLAENIFNIVTVKRRHLR